MCNHEHFESMVSVYRCNAVEGGPITHYSAQIVIRCAQCKAVFEFQGLPVGISPYTPTIDIGATLLNAPLMPPGEKIAPGLPGYVLKVGIPANDAKPN